MCSIFSCTSDLVTSVLNIHFWWYSYHLLWLSVYGYDKLRNMQNWYVSVVFLDLIDSNCLLVLPQFSLIIEYNHSTRKINCRHAPSALSKSAISHLCRIIHKPSIISGDLVNIKPSWYQENDSSTQYISIKDSIHFDVLVRN